MAIEVLVVDEDESVLEITEAFLGRQDGRVVTTETDARRALERVFAGEFDADVSDLSMPSLSGTELCDRVRADRGGIPFFVFTGRDRAEFADEADAAGVTGVVRKGTGTEQYETLAERIRASV
jgi:CheY-like chemotaxis protein